MAAFEIVVGPQLTADELFGFYERNNIGETGLGKEVAARILHHPHVMVAAFADDELIGLARATFDGLSAAIMELSLDVRWQGRGPDGNGSLVEGDPHGVGAELGHALLAGWDRCSSRPTSSVVSRSGSTGRSASARTPATPSTSSTGGRT